MKLVAFTIVLDGEPFIERHLPILQQLKIPWHWIVVEGASGNTADTSWCKPQEPRWSNDGTTEYLSPFEISESSIGSVSCGRTRRRCVTSRSLELPSRVSSCRLTRTRLGERINWKKSLACSTSIHRWRRSKFACRYFVGPSYEQNPQY